MRFLEKKGIIRMLGSPSSPSIDSDTLLGESLIHHRILMDFTSRDVMEHEDLGFDRN